MTIADNKRDHVFRVMDFNELNSITSSVQKKACMNLPAKDPLPNTTEKPTLNTVLHTVDRSTLPATTYPPILKGWSHFLFFSRRATHYYVVTYLNCSTEKIFNRDFLEILKHSLVEFVSKS